MIVCSCTLVTDHDIRRAVAWMRASDPQVMITPGKVYRALGKKADCGGCIRLFVDTIWNHSKLDLPPDLLTPISDQEGQRNERRRESHRVPEQGAPQRADGDQPILAALPPAE
ncbi:MAG: (2Fe-2S)-binding protein [Pseudomonadota bacterium]